MSYSDYYPFGSILPGRSFSSNSYRFGFNGKEKDDELKGSGNSYDFGARIYDPRLGRWLKIDPLFAKFPNISTYTFADNSPIILIDPDGRQITLVGKVSNKKTTIIYNPGDKPPAGADQFILDAYASLDHLYSEAGVDAQGLVTELVDAEQNINLESTKKIGKTSYTSAAQTIKYNPAEGLITNAASATGNDRQSPALGLLHELDHASEHFRLMDEVKNAENAWEAAKETGNKEFISATRQSLRDADDALVDFETKTDNIREENRVVKGSETKTANFLKQGIRIATPWSPAYDGWTSPFIAKCPTCTDKASTMDTKTDKKIIKIAENKTKADTKTKETLIKNTSKHFEKLKGKLESQKKAQPSFN